jgi:hypothetical protein
VRRAATSGCDTVAQPEHDTVAQPEHDTVAQPERHAHRESAANSYRGDVGRWPFRDAPASRECRALPDAYQLPGHVCQRHQAGAGR